MSADKAASSPSRWRHRLARRRITASFAVGAVAAALALGACSSSSAGGAGASGGGNSASGGTISLGISVPLSGAVGSSCTPMNQAMLAWFNHVNDTGGVNGKKIKVDNRDDGYTAARAVTNTRAFIAEKVLAVTGQCGSLQPPAQVPLLTAAKVPFLFVFGASNSMLHPLSPEYFNLMPTYGDQLAAEIPYVFQHYGKGSVVLMNTVTPDSPTTTTQVQTAVKSAGGTFLGQYNAPPGTADFSPYVLQMKQQHPDYVIIDQIPQDAARLIQEMTSQDFMPAKNIIGSNAVSQATFLSSVSTAVQPKLLLTSDVLAPASAGGTQCESVLKAASIAVTGVTLRGCGTAQVVVKALQDTKGTLTSQALVNTIQGWTNVQASEVYPPLTFTSTNHVGVTQLYVFSAKNNAFTQVGKLSLSGS
ncbi:MAG TPA: ABC transporter substrate-binding protein [Trebonia sp.]|jgi:ABC-type branched-subunit amino acid transport system substrate-binding protein|nr:ABC transporter substrate-binding protein [Trebonia sp.]